MCHSSLKIVLAALAVLALCHDHRGSCSVLSNRDERLLSRKPRMAEGTNARFGQFPWMAFINQHFNDTWDSNCGGTIISARWVLTSAHCIYKGRADFSVFVGEIDQGAMSPDHGSRGFMIMSKKRVTHPEFNIRTLHNDIGFLWLEKNIPFRDEIQPIRLTTINELDLSYDKKKVAVVGWGIDGTQHRTGDLKYGYERIISKSECSKARRNVEEEIICTVGGSPSVICVGDSGGPLLARISDEFVQIGIISGSASNKCPNNSPQYFTRLSSYYNYIKNITGIEY